jgi:hypothetical protein
MSFETFKAALDVQNKLHASLYLISGGEPFLHPEFEDFLLYAIEQAEKNGKQIAVLSNGLRLVRDKKFQYRFKRICDKHPRCLSVQITADPRFYPHAEEIIKEAGFLTREFQKVSLVVDTKIHHIDILGRARNLPNALELSCFMHNSTLQNHPANPNCMNCLLLGHQSSSWQTFQAIAEMNGRHCLMLCDWEGKVHVGESMECQELGTIQELLADIDTENQSLFQKFKGMKLCGKCKTYNVDSIIQRFNLK